MQIERRQPHRHRDLAKLFGPESIAVYGASAKPASFGARTLARLERDYVGALYRVNPRYERVGEAICYPDLAALPEIPDCVVIALPQEAVEAAVEDCIKARVGGIVVFASGYAETGTAEGIENQARLAWLARSAGIRIAGPNCFGFLNFKLRAGVSFNRGDISFDSFRDTGIGLVSQSGALAFAQAQGTMRGVSMSHVIAAGNSCDVDVADVAAYLAEEPACSAIVCILEGLSDPLRLMVAGELAWQAGKPMIVCKLGTGTEGARAALSHSGSLAGSLDAYRAACDRAGIVLLDDLDAALDTASFFIGAPRFPAAKGVGIVAISGGAGVYATDRAEAAGVPTPQPSPKAEARLIEILPPFAAPRNPCDVTAMALRDMTVIPNSCEAFAADPRFGAVLYPQTSVTPSTAEELGRVADACARHGKPACALWLTGWVTGHGARECENHPNLSVFRNANHCFEALAAWHRLGDRQTEISNESAIGPARASPPSALLEARSLLEQPLHPGLTESDAKQILSAYGVDVVPERLAGSAEEAVEAASAFGFPVVLKIESEDLPHKTEAGGVRLGLDTAVAVSSAYDEILRNATRAAPTARIRGVSVQPMLKNGIEIVIGGRVDPQFGPLILVGLGGVMVEIVRDTVLDLAPISPTRATSLLRRLKSQQVLDGFRGSPGVDRDALATTLSRLSEFVADCRNLVAEFDVNPLICNGSSIIAADALIVRKSEEKLRK